MTIRPRRSRTAWARVMAALLLPGVLLACGPGGRREWPRNAPEPESTAPYQAEVEEGLGAAVAILIDTSGSMKERAPGDAPAQHEVAKEALDAMLDATDAFIARRPDFPIKIGALQFLQRCQHAAPFSRTTAPPSSACWRTCPAPAAAPRSATPCARRGRSLPGGVFRKYLLVVTDGENTNGVTRGGRARHLEQEPGRVQVFSRPLTPAPRSSRF